MNECDFCLTESEHLISVNGGLWAICSVCNDFVHLQMTIINKQRKKERLCGHGVPYADCGCEEE